MHQKLLFISFVTISLLNCVTAYAENHEHMDHQKHMASMSGDQRQLAEFPPEMRVHFLSNMREHLQTLSEITAAMAEGQYDQAAKIANTKLGMDSASAAGCKVDNSLVTKDSKSDAQDHRMMQYMPTSMRKAGIEMHQAASDFAVEVAKVPKTGDSRPALSALSRITQRCVSCHASFRAQ
jgi:hypothetical protein